jgi:hypothetical protein
MSLSYQKLDAVCVKDPRTIINNKRDYAVLEGGSQFTFKQWTSTSIANSGIQFSAPPPSPDIIVDRRIYFYCPFRLTFVGIPAAGQTLLNMNSDAPRQFPVNSAIDTISATINNFSMTVNSADVVPALLRYNVDNLLKNHYYSTAPSYPDQSALYSALNGSIRSPLAGYGDSTDENLQGRGGFANYVIVSNPVGNGTTPVTAVVDMASSEPLFLLSPFYWGAKETSGFTHVNSMDFNITFLTQAVNRLWSRSDSAVPLSSFSFVVGNLPNGPTSFNNTSGNVPYLLIGYITPKEKDIIPREMPITYPYFKVDRFATDYGATLASNAPFDIVSNNIQLSSIPRRIYCYVRQRNQDLYSSPTNTDTFLQIQKINVQFQNKNGLLNSSNMMQLYYMCVKNHCSLSWTQWSGGPSYVGSFTNQVPTVGSIICIEPGTDIGLDDLEAPGKLENITLQIEVIGQNLGPAVSPTLYLVIVNEGTFTIETIGRSSANIGVISSQDILDCKAKPFLNYEDVQSVNGGDFLTGLKEFFTQTIPGLLRKSKLASNLANLIPVVGPAVSKSISNLGYGHEDYGEGVLLDEPYRSQQDYRMGQEGEGVRVGGVPVGGRHLDRRHLRSHMRKRVIM